MIHSKSVLAALVFLLIAVLFAGCEKFDDVQPPRMSRLKVHNDQFTTGKNTGIYLNILANDTIGSQAIIEFVQPQHGTLKPDSVPGRLFYVPDLNFTGTDSFTYKACMDKSCATALVTIMVLDSVLPCTLKANADTVTLTHHALFTDSVSVHVLDNDSYCVNGAVPVPVVLASPQPRYGVVTTSGTGADFRFVYSTSVHATNIQDTFGYRICEVVNGQQVCSDTEVVILIR